MTLFLNFIEKLEKYSVDFKQEFKRSVNKKKVKDILQNCTYVRDQNLNYWVATLIN